MRSAEWKITRMEDLEVASPETCSFIDNRAGIHAVLSSSSSFLFTIKDKIIHNSQLW